MTPNPYLPPIANPAFAQEPPVLAQLAGEDGGLTVQSAIELEDMIAFAVYQNMRSPFGNKQFRKRWLFIGGTMIAFLAMACWVVVNLGLSPNGVVALVAVAVFVIAYVALYPWSYARQLRQGCIAACGSGRNLAVFGPRRTTLTPEFLIQSSPYTQSMVRWIAVERIDLQPAALYLYLASNSAFIIPRRAFASEEDFQSFGRACQEHHARAAATPHS